MDLSFVPPVGKLVVHSSETGIEKTDLMVEAPESFKHSIHKGQNVIEGGLRKRNRRDLQR